MLQKGLTLGTGIAIRVASIASLACANATVVPGRAERIDCTLAGINTLSVPTGKRVTTVRVNFAFVALALNFWVALSIILTVTASLVVFSLAVGIHATLLERTRVLAFFVDASLVVSTFRMIAATGCSKKKRVREG